jgi:hypothetical protein
MNSKMMVISLILAPACIVKLEIGMDKCHFFKGKEKCGYAIESTVFLSKFVLMTLKLVCATQEWHGQWCTHKF